MPVRGAAPNQAGSGVVGPREPGGDFDQGEALREALDLRRSW
jgi:hypothetical protein